MPKNIYRNFNIVFNITNIPWTKIILTSGEFNFCIRSLIVVEKGSGLIKGFDRPEALVSWGPH
jgi:hypothetical protein